MWIGIKFCDKHAIINSVKSKIHLLLPTTFAIFFDRISVIPVVARHAARVPNRMYARAVSPLPPRPASIESLISATPIPPTRPAANRDTSMDKSTLIFSKQSTHKSTTPITTGLSKFSIK